ncbi:hypothetical protein EIP86_002154 [Pleurotus ostreatoroseus]|nr:hypothetical protein EIP86_002154 [Pleurotus ostreatoroseus]
MARGGIDFRETLLSSNLKLIGDDGLNLDDQQEQGKERLRADTFERSYAVQWLTALVSHVGEISSTPEAALNGPQLAWEAVVQQAARLLAVCAGAASAGLRTRTFVFPGTGRSRSSSRSPGTITPVAAADITHNPSLAALEVRVQITDIPLDNQNYDSVGAQTWGGACLLADMIVGAGSETDVSLPLGTSAERTRPLRVLELGAGTGLVGVTVGKLLKMRRVQTEVVATDFHPDVLENLRHNFATNLSQQNDILTTCVEFLDWSIFPSQTLQQNQPSSLAERFDVIYGADIIYELEHARWIKTCVELLLRKPDPSSQALTEVPRFHLVTPLRKTHIAESHTVEDVFSFADGVHSDGVTGAHVVLAITAKEEIVCWDLWNESAKEVEYVHYTITWVSN